MLEKVIKTYIFLDPDTSRILAVKKSHDHSFFINSKLWKCFCVESITGIQIRANLSQSWSPTEGLRSLENPNPENLIQLQILQRKIEILLAIKATLFVIEKQMKPRFSIQRLLSVPVRRVHFYKLWKLIKTEKLILKKRVTDFYTDLQLQVEESDSIEKLNHLYEGLNKNLTLGGYAAFSMDLEEDHVKRN